MASVITLSLNAVDLVEFAIVDSFLIMNNFFEYFLIFFFCLTIDRNTTATAEVIPVIYFLYKSDQYGTIERLAVEITEYS